ncbi:VanZ family protein [Clostridium taeniosporum]|uniref:VanZ family protein n=1 Tax=Clostridium taeniosporum TaxID=394958 RepID=A0A1D7XP67_9CLOT|nr:VanZ family protein [Clostridium taeniosporum]AOR25104.1 VanZ family protein [Clostridium taeniosporum]
MTSCNLSIKERYNIIFLISLFIISFSVLIAMILILFANSSDISDLKRPVPYLLLPIYLIVRLVFLKIEIHKNIKTNKFEEIVKLLLFIYFLTIISVKFFPLDKDCVQELLATNILSFSTLFSLKSVMIIFTRNLILFMPLGFLTPIIISKMKNISNCAIISLIFSIAIYLLQITLHYIGIYFLVIISLDMLLSNIIGALIGYGIYHFISNHNKDAIMM